MKLAIPFDKLEHLVVGYCIAATVMPFGWIAACAAVFAAGALKEWGYDRHHRDTHTVDWRDFAATLTGGAAFIGWWLAVPTVVIWAGTVVSALASTFPL